MQRVACQPHVNQKVVVPYWRKPNNSRVTLTTTRLSSASHLASAQSCIKQSGNIAFGMDALAQHMSLYVF